MKSLSVQNVGKAYRTYRSEWHRFARWAGLPVKPVDEHWVLRGIDFDVRPGEAVGLIGRNGAGKSTLLKMLTGTLRPTEGCVSVNGKVFAILELGMGFNPELTGRQNAAHALSVMEADPRAAAAAMEYVEDFAEIGEYFDRPLRVYSSGMQMRVAFSVVTAMRPEILIIDEALAVGDAYFQHKSFDRIREFRDQNTTLLIVSHDRSAVQTLCDRAIMLADGAVVRDGPPEEVFDYYNATLAENVAPEVTVTRHDDGRARTSSGTGEAKVSEIGLYNRRGEQVEAVGVGETIELRVRVRVYEAVESLVLGYGVRDRLGQVMYGTNTWHTNQVISSPSGGDEYEFSIRFPANFGIGTYSIQTALVDRDTHLSANYDWQDLALVFRVENFDKTAFDGCLWNEPTIEVRSLAS
ncbi:MAG: ABC transporter ATP-binding protein [Planctomycetota bacterium]